MINLGGIRPNIIRNLIVVVISLLGWGGSIASHAADCEAILDNPPRPLVETHILFEYLDNIDRADCPRLPEAEFNTFVEPIEVNLVSYVLLEKRLSESTGTGAQAIQAYLRQYTDARIKLDDNAILPLIDIGYFECKGDQACIGKTVLSLVDGMDLTKPAACLYGMPATCGPEDLREGFYFLNDSTLAALPATEDAFAQRSQFICSRYKDCGGSTQTETD